MYGEGISKEGSILDIGAEIDIVSKSGAWYSFNDERLGQGRENAKLFLKENPEIAAQIEAKVREYFSLNPNSIPSGDAVYDPEQDEEPAFDLE
jgi:recombination protein RecA